MKEVDLSLPECAWVFGSEYEENDATCGREIVLHIPSAGIVEILRDTNYEIPEMYAAHIFTGKPFGEQETEYVAVLLNYEIDNPADAELVKKEILFPVTRWYCRQQKYESRGYCN